MGAGYTNKGMSRSTTFGYTKKNGLLLWVKFHQTYIVSAEYDEEHMGFEDTMGQKLASFKPRSVTINSGGWLHSPTTLRHIRNALSAMNVPVTLPVRKGVVFLARSGWGTDVWDGEPYTFDPREERACVDLPLHRVGYHASTGDKQYQSIYVQAADKLSAIIAARLKLPPEAVIRGAYNP